MKRSIPITAGFTLIETILYVAIVATLSGVIFQTLRLFDEASVRGAAHANVSGEASFVTRRLREVLRGAHVSVPGSGAVSAALTTDSGTVVEVIDGALTIRTSADEISTLTSGHVTVSSLSFQNYALSDTPDLIGIRFTLTASPGGSVPGASYSDDFNATIGTR